MSKEIEKIVVDIFKIGLMDAQQFSGKPSPMKALKAHEKQIIEVIKSEKLQLLIDLEKKAQPILIEEHKMGNIYKEGSIPLATIQSIKDNL